MTRPGSSAGPASPEPWVVGLADRDAARADLAGAKAAALAVAAAAGLPVEPGVVLTTAGVSRWRHDGMVVDALRDAWRSLSDGGQRPVIVRSSSTVEDAERSSMAGVFRSVLDVRGFPEVTEAIDEIVGHAAQHSDAPLAVLVQPMVAATVGGVLFGADPVTARAPIGSSSRPSRAVPMCSCKASSTVRATCWAGSVACSKPTRRSTS